MGLSDFRYQKLKFQISSVHEAIVVMVLILMRKGEYPKRDFEIQILLIGMQSQSQSQSPS